MTTGATGQLGLALPVQGELSGTWGDTVNNGITQYTNIAIAGTLTLTGDGAVTLANTTGDASASNITSTLAGAGTVTAQFAIVQVSGTTTTKVVTGPSYSKTYVVDNASSYAVTFKASGQTGVSIAAAEKVTVVFNGTDYIKLAGTIANAAGSNTQIQFNNGGLFGASANLTWDGTTLSSTQVNITGQGTLRLQDTTGGEYVGLRSPSALGASYTLTFPADDGTSGQALITDGSGVLSWSTAASGDVYGPASSTANGIALFDGTTGKLLKDAAATDGLIYGLTLGRGLAGVASNTAFGSAALSANTTGSASVAVGYQALKAQTTGYNNNALGFQSLLNNTTGAVNNAFGQGALKANTTGSSNSAFGDGALQSNTTASNNTAVGYQSLYTNVTGAQNTAVGTGALLNFTASNTTAIGYNALTLLTTGTGNVAVGTEALAAVTTASDNTAVGRSALGVNTAAQNTAVGRSALVVNTTGASNTATGYRALAGNTTGASNASFGVDSLLSNTTGGFNTALGALALNANTTASNNTAIGYQAQYSNTTGTENVAVGKGALYTNSTGNFNNAFGSGALNANTVSYNSAFGHGSLNANTTGAENAVFGGAAALVNTTGSGLTGMGYTALRFNTTGSNNTAIGDAALYSNTTASNNTAVGYQAGYSNTTGTQLAALGYQAAYANTTGFATTAVGVYAMLANTTGDNNTSVGYRTLYSNTTGSQNVAVGRDALFSNTTASNNTAVGHQAGYTNSTGNSSTFVGYQAGYTSNNSATYSGNTCLGYRAGYSLTTGVNNTFVGGLDATNNYASGSLITTGSKNTILGNYAGNQGGLDIRTANNYIVLSDGDGNPRGIFDGSGNLGLGVAPTSTWATNRKVLQLGGSAGTVVAFNGTSGSGEQFYNSYFNTSSQNIYNTTTYAGKTDFNIASAGGFTWQLAPSGTAGNAITFTQAMTLTNAGNLGIGTSSPDSKLVVQGGSGTYAQIKDGTVNTFIQARSADSVGVVGTLTNHSLAFWTNTTSRMTLDTSGNLGLGVTPSAWSLGKAFEVGTVGNGLWTVGNSNIYLVANTYYSSGAYRYASSTFASAYEQENGVHKWRTAPSGTAGDAITFTQAMTLNASGNLGVGTTSIPTVGSTQVLAVGNSNGGTHAIVQSGSIVYRTSASTSGVDCYNPNASPITWYTSGTGRLILDASGNLGLGVTPSAWQTTSYKVLQVNKASIMSEDVTAVRLNQNYYVDSAYANRYIGTGYASYYAQINGAHQWQTAASGTAGAAVTFTQAMTLDASGNLGVGTTSPVQKLDVSSASTADTDLKYNMVVRSTDAYTTTPQAGIAFATAFNTTQNLPLCGIFGGKENATLNDFASKISFATRANGGNIVERARITSGGYFKSSDTGTYVGATGTYNEFRQSDNNHILYLSCSNTSVTNSALFIVDANRNTTNNTFYAMGYYNNAAAAYKFRVADSGNVTNTNGTYGTISDVKMKKDIVDAGSQWADIKAIRFRKFKMIDDPEQIVQLGVIAQELEQTSSGLVEEHKDIDKDGNDLGTTTKSVKTSILLMKAAVALQEAMNRIEQLEARLDAANL